MLTRTRLDSGLLFCFFSSLLLLPFNRSPRVTLLGELSLEAAVYPVLLGICLIGVSKRISVIKHISFFLLLALLAWSLLSVVVNLDSIAEYYTKGRSGYRRLFTQLFVYLFMLAGSVFVYQALNTLRFKTHYLMLRQWIFISFAVTACYSLFEIALLYGVTEFAHPLKWVNQYLHDDPMLFYRGRRLHSVSGEPSWYGKYLALIFPWLLSYLFHRSAKPWINYSFMLWLAFMLFLTYSRTVYIIIVIEVIIFIGLLGIKKRLSFTGYNAVLGLLLLFFLVQSLSINITLPGVSRQINALAPEAVQASNPENLQRSNLGRIRSQQAAFDMALNNPVFGIGIGQYGFLMPSYIAADALSSFEVLEWIATGDDTPWPPVHGLHARIVAEQGFIGLMLWLLVWITLAISVYQKCRHAIYEHQLLGIILLSSLAGVFLIGFSMGTYRVFEFWIIMAFCWAYIRPTRISR